MFFLASKRDVHITVNNIIYFEILKTKRVSPKGIYVFIHQNLIFHRSVPLKDEVCPFKGRMGMKK